MTKKVLFVCLGNICRSPIAEAVFLHLLEQTGKQKEWKVDSAGIGGWHVGNLPDIRARDVLQKHNIKYDNRARQIRKKDFAEYDFIFGMDDENMEDLKRLSKNVECRAQLILLGSFDPKKERIIRDPYYDSGSEGFEKCFKQCLRCCAHFLKQCATSN